MRSIKHTRCDTVLRGGAPHIPDLHIRRGDESDDGSMPIVASYWRPTPDELAELVAGGVVEVVILGFTHPPISIRTTPAEASPISENAQPPVLPDIPAQPDERKES